jgi:hypothetical protein
MVVLKGCAASSPISKISRRAEASPNELGHEGPDRKFLDVTTRSRLTAQSRELPEARLIETTTGIHVQRHG